MQGRLRRLAKDLKLFMLTFNTRGILNKIEHMKFDKLINSLLNEEELSDRERRIQALRSAELPSMITPEEQEENEQRHEAAEELWDELWDEDGEGEVGLAPLHYAITGVEWDGEDESHFDEIIEVMREKFKTKVSIDPEREAVILIGALEEEEDI